MKIENHSPPGLVLNSLFKNSRIITKKNWIKTLVFGLSLFLNLGMIESLSAQSHTFPSFNVGTITSGTIGQSVNLPAAALTGDYQFFTVSADFAGSGNPAWSSAMEMELSNGSGIIYQEQIKSTAGTLDDGSAITIHWTGVMTKKYSGGQNLVVRFVDDYTDGSGPYTSTISNVKITICQPFETHSFAPIVTGVITSNIPAGQSIALPVAGLTGDYLFFEVEATYGGGNTQWSEEIRLEFTDGGSVLLSEGTKATSGSADNTNSTTLYWTGMMNKSYVGATNLTARFTSIYDDAFGPYTSQLMNVKIDISRAPQPHTFPSFNSGVIASSTSGQTIALAAGALTGDYLFFDVQADFVAGASSSWSDEIQIEFSDGGSVILSEATNATSGSASNSNATALHWTGVMNKTYIGGGNLSARFFTEYEDASGPYSSSLSNVNITIAKCAGSSTVCPTVGAASASETSVCEGAAFNLAATGLANMANTDNSDQDYGIEFKAFTSTPADPYVGGSSLGTVAFGSLTGVNTTASYTGATLGTAGSYEIYSILSPTPTDGTCRPSAMTAITVNAIPTAAAVGSNQFVVGLNNSASLGGNTPSVGTGAWTIVSGGTGTFSSMTSGNSTFSGDAIGSYTLRWTTSNGTCPSSSADITVEFSNDPIIYNNVGYTALKDAIDAAILSGVASIIEIVGAIAPPENNTIPSNITIEVKDGIAWTNNVELINNGTIELMGSGTFSNESSGEYKGVGTFIGDFDNKGTMKPGD